MPVSYGSPYVTMRLAKPFDYKTLGCVILEAGIDQGGNYQILTSVSDLINIDIFGDEPATVTMSGLAFLQTCDGVPNGVDAFLDYYNTNKLSAQEKPVTIIFGTSQKFSGFLTQSNCRIADPEIGLGHFNMKFMALPTS